LHFIPNSFRLWRIDLHGAPINAVAANAATADESRLRLFPLAPQKLFYLRRMSDLIHCGVAAATKIATR
jgi:hypothetical protein